MTQSTPLVFYLPASNVFARYERKRVKKKGTETCGNCRPKAQRPGAPQKGLDRADIVIALGKAWKRRNRR
jgi:hypothetical protein